MEDTGQCPFLQFTFLQLELGYVTPNLEGRLRNVVWTCTQDSEEPVWSMTAELCQE